MPWLISETEWLEQTRGTRVANKRSIQWFNRYIRPGTTLAGGFAYLLVTNILAFINVPCVMAHNLLAFDYGWIEMLVSTIILVGIYTGISIAVGEYLMWAYVPSRRLYDVAGKDRDARTRGA